MQLVKKVEPITAEFVFSKIDSYDIYRNYIGEFIVGSVFQNPVIGRQETPSFGIYMKDGRLFHADFSPNCSDIHGDCVALVQQLYQLTYPKAIQKIAADFQLTSGTDEYKKIIQGYKKPILDQKRHCLIQVSARKWNASDAQYWNQYGISIDDLKAEEVYPVREFFLNRKKQQIKKDERVYAYRYPMGFKIYMVDRKKGEKWLSNIPMDTPVHLENLSKEYNGLVVKSLKDFIVCKKLYQHTCYVQNESIGSVTEKTSKYITENSRKVFYGGDSDIAGKTASYKITGKYKWLHLNPPDRLLPDVKDFSDWVKEEGYDKLEEHFVNKGLINAAVKS